MGICADQTLKHRLAQFFADNPDEELTKQQIAVKFGVSQWTVREVLQSLTRSGALESVRVVRAVAKGRAS